MEIEKQNFEQLPVMKVNGQVIVQGRVPSIFSMPDLIRQSLD